MGRHWLDISLPIGPDSIAWAGLATPRLSWVAEIAAGDSVSVGRLECCLHSGTHADAPRHVLRDGTAAEQLDVAAFIGLAVVVRTEDPAVITEAELVAAGLERRRPQRVLIATPSQYDGRNFPLRIPHLEPSAAEFLVHIGVRLVGVNVPSLDPLDSSTMEAHKILFGAGACILENLALTGVDAGEHELVAPPLAVVGGDAAPVRALLRSLE